MKKKYLFIAAALMGMSLSGCYDLDQQPQGELSSATAFGSTAEITLYLNQFYQGSVQISGGGSVTNTVIKGQSTNVGNASGIAFTDLNSDDLIGAVINTRLAGQTALSNAGDLIEYYIIRNINFLLHNINNCTEQGTTAFNQCLGEAYYFRAACYYQLLIKYGGVTWMEDLLDPDKSLMELPRNTRTEITDHILADLDLAIQNLNSVGSNASMRVHKDVARALKSEVALFAGTWEKYHRQKNTPFYDHTLSDADAQAKIQSYLTQAYQAAEEVMNTGTWRIHNTGNPLTDYRDMFIDLDLTDNQEVLWWKKYDAAAGIGHAVTRFLNKGGGQCGPSANLVDDYLTIDGRPFVGDEKLAAKRHYGDELQPTVRDPRLSQTVCLPGQPLRPNNEYVFQYPPLNGNSYHQNTSGYSVLKYVEFNTTYQPTVEGEFSSQAPAIQVRYADVLLNYAEALAELDGAGNATRIQNALQPLRGRVGMPGVDFDREFNSDPSYPFHDLDKYIQAVRRERHVEKALEGCRLNDILRWAAADVLIRDVTPIGALFVGSDLEEQNQPGGFYATEGLLVYDQAEGNSLYLTGNPGDALRYIVPFNNEGYPNGWQFNLERDYLQPIKEEMVNPGDLTNGAWEQNPGW